MRTLCAEVAPEDGTDPRDWLKGLHGPKPDRRKARQLCAQVAEALAMALAAEADDALRSLDVVSVEPSPDTARLLVTVRPMPGAPPDPGAILGALARASGRLRAEVAAAITRRRAPRLAYRVMIGGGPRGRRRDVRGRASYSGAHPLVARFEDPFFGR